MDSENEDLPFEEGQLVESRSFQKGYRGAWFRSKINKIAKRKGEVGVFLDYLDFLERNKWTKAYQKRQGYDTKGKRKCPKKHELMIRPSFPPIYRKSKMPDLNTISEPIVVINDAWKVGDLIDWLKDDCYWSGSITQTEEDDKYKIRLLPPPLGEGLSYGACCDKDLRPSLNWSLEDGWTVPIPEGYHNSCARIVHPKKEGKVLSSVARNTGNKITDVEDTVGASQSLSASSSSSSQPRDQSKNIETSTSTPRKEKRTPETDVMSNSESDQAAKTNSDSSSYVKSTSSEETEETEEEEEEETEERRDVLQDTAASLDSSPPRDKLGKRPLVSAEEKETRATETNGSPVKAGSVEVGKTLSEKDGPDCDGPAKKSRVDGEMPLNSTFSEAAEASILDLEELLHRIKWIKGMLQNGKDSSNATRPPWKFLEHRGSSTTR